MQKDKTHKYMISGFCLFPAVLLFLFLFLAMGPLFPHHGSATSLDGEQRERIQEIDRELKDLRHGKHLPSGYSSSGLRGIRHFSNPKYARVVLDLTSLPADSFEVNEVRNRGLVIKLRNTKVLIPSSGCNIKSDKGFLKCISVNRKRNVLSVSIDVESNWEDKVFTLRSPSRIVVDLYKKEGIAGRKQVHIASLPQKRGKYIVVLDPGHGGKDPGAIGRRGLKEKNVVLRIGKKVKRYLDGSGRFKTYLTRHKDKFIPLDKRAAVANGLGADIFVSIHNNASRKRKTGGISTFVLGKKATDREALELAMQENGVVLEDDSKVSYILRDLINSGKGNESRRLAKVINDRIVKAVRAKRKKVLNLGVKKAPFYVLFGASMPAVLVEASFISNPSEERLLKNDWYLDLIARSIYEGIVNYIDRSKTALYGRAD